MYRTRAPAVVGAESASDGDTTASESENESQDQQAQTQTRPRRRSQTQNQTRAPPTTNDAAPNALAAPSHSSPQSTPRKAPAVGFLSQSRKLRLPDAHQPWGQPYEHPTLISPNGKRIDRERDTTGGWNMASSLAATTTATTGVAQQGPTNSSPKKAPAAGAGEEKERDADGVNVDEAAASRVAAASLSKSRAREAAQVGITSKLINTVAPPAAPYTAFSEASRYHDIIHPPSSPRSLLLAKLAAPDTAHGRAVPAGPREGLPLAPTPWHLTAKLAAPRGTGNGGMFSSPDGFDATLAERDARLFSGAPTPGSMRAPGSSAEQRAADRARRTKARADLAAQQALALEMGLVPGSVGTSGSGSAWAGLELTPRPRTRNDSRGRKEVLRMLDAFRRTPKGVQVLAVREAQQEMARERDAAMQAGRPVTRGGGVDAQQAGAAAARAHLASAPTSQQVKIPFSPRSFARAQSVANGGTASHSARAATSHGDTHGFVGSASARGFASPRTPSAFGVTGSLASSGFFPGGSTGGGVGSSSYASSFHAALGASHRSGSSTGSAASATASFHRVLPPSFMNAPARVETLSLEAAKMSRARIRAGAAAAANDARFVFSGAVVADRRTARKKKAASVESLPLTNASANSHDHHAPVFGLPPPRPQTTPPALPLASELDLSSTHAAIRDYEVRALACNRAGRRAAEANAHFCMGVLWDNARQHLRAVACYQRFEEILCGGGGNGGAQGGRTARARSASLRTAEDAFAESLAHNSIGVSYQNLGDGYYEQALYHHALHRDIADTPGQLIAYTNMGLIYQLMATSAAADAAAGDSHGVHGEGGVESKTLTEHAAYHHQQALRCAIRMGSLAGQNIAIGNLGLTGLQHADLATARACMERHLQLSQSLDDYRGQSAAYQTLGTIASQQGQHEEAMIYYQSAQQMAHVLNDAPTADQAKVQVGVAKANAQMDLAMRRMAEIITTSDSSANNHM